jgi:HEAT repeat protein
LKTALRLPTAPPEKGPVYRGRAASFWLEQMKDGDPSYRVDAITALGALAHQQKTLMPALVSALKDKDYKVGTAASKALSAFGKEAVPALIEVVKDKTSSAGRSQAIQALGKIGLDAKAAVPWLAQVLQSDGFDSWHEAIGALHSFGPEAKAAVPSLVDALGRVLQHFQDKKIEIQQGSMPANIVFALLAIDPEVENVLPRELVLFVDGRRGGAGRSPFDSTPANRAVPWQEGLQKLKKKYTPTDK